MSKEISRESKKNMNQIAQTLYLTTDFSLLISPVRYAKFESIRYFIDIDILQNCLINIRGERIIRYSNIIRIIFEY